MTKNSTVCQVISFCVKGENIDPDHCALQEYIGAEVIKLFSCSSQLGMNFNLLIHIKMPTIVAFYNL